MNKYIIDGIVSKDDYGQNGHKVLFILKEAVIKNDEWNNLVSFLYNGAKNKRSKTWENVILWNFILRNYDNESVDKSFASAKKLLKNRSYELRNTAVININKNGSRKSSTVSKSLYNNFISNADDGVLAREIILRQIEEINPEVILCGGVVVKDCLTYILPGIKWHSYSEETMKASYALYEGRIIIQYYHPQYYRFTREKLYNTLKSLLKKINGDK